MTIYNNENITGCSHDCCRTANTFHTQCSHFNSQHNTAKAGYCIQSYESCIPIVCFSTVPCT